MTRSMIEHDLVNDKKQDLAIKSCGVNNLNPSSFRNKIVYIFQSVLLVNLVLIIYKRLIHTYSGLVHSLIKPQHMSKAGAA